MSETIFHGVGVSPGVAFGTACPIATAAPRIPRYTIATTGVDEELDRLEQAVSVASADILRVRDALIKAGKKDEAAIFDSHILILEDVEFLGDVRDRIERDLWNAERAFHAALLDTIGQLEESDSLYMRERARDIRDVEYRVVRALIGEIEPIFATLPEDAIVIAHDLPASVMAELDRDRIVAFATEIGAPTSHTAILARALEIPAVIDLGPVLQNVSDGAAVVLDGGEGVLVVEPSAKTRERYRGRRDALARVRRDLVELAAAPAVTADGERLVFQANLEFAREVDGALAFGCEGVGLYRTEYLFLQYGGEASEDVQYDVYRKLVERMSGRPVTIRTVDLGGDKLLSGMEPEDNPFLGWRAIRYCLDRPDVFQAQLRAILRAGAHGPVSIMIPMIVSIEEAEMAFAHLDAARESLVAAGVDHADSCPVGVLIETPAAALMAEEFARQFDFLSLGTNDLVQYTLAVDRGNRRIAHLFQPFHPAVLRLIRDVCAASHDAGVEITVCGEMGGQRTAAALLLGLGIRRFSMVPARIPTVKQVLSRITTDEAERAAASVLGARTAEIAQNILTEWLDGRLEMTAAHSEPDV